VKKLLAGSENQGGSQNFERTVAGSMVGVPVIPMVLGISDIVSDPDTYKLGWGRVYPCSRYPIEEMGCELGES
jgi:hypothetical protein